MLHFIQSIVGSYKPTNYIVMSSSTQSLIKIGAISGILSIIFYISVAVFSFLPDFLTLLLAFTFPLLWIVSFMGLYKYLKATNPTATLEIAYIFGIIGGALACTLLVVQQANILWDAEAQLLNSYESKKEFFEAAYRGANRVQAGLDVVFDIFITIAWVLFGLNIAKNKKFGKIIGWLGSGIAFALLALNMYTFPNAPAESGLFDLGPFLGIWSLIFYIWFTVIAFKKHPNPVSK